MSKKIMENKETHAITSPASYLLLTSIFKAELNEDNKIILGDDSTQEELSPPRVIEYNHPAYNNPKKNRDLARKAIIETIERERQATTLIVLFIRILEHHDSDYFDSDDFLLDVKSRLNKYEVNFGHHQIIEPNCYIVTLCSPDTIPDTERTEIVKTIKEINQLEVSAVKIISNEELVTAYLWGYGEEMLNALTEEEYSALERKMTLSVYRKIQ